LEDLTTEVFGRLRRDSSMGRRHSHALHSIQKVVASLGFCDPRPVAPSNVRRDIKGTPTLWCDYVDRWWTTSTLTPKVQTSWRSVLAKAGRWLAEHHPDITEPAQWSRQTCVDWIAAIDRMSVGDYVQHHQSLPKRVGEPLSARTKAGYITAIRTFFRDLQRLGMDPAPVRSASRAGHAQKHHRTRGPNPASSPTARTCRTQDSPHRPTYPTRQALDQVRAHRHDRESSPRGTVTLRSEPTAAEEYDCWLAQFGIVSAESAPALVRWSRLFASVSICCALNPSLK
jgi:hypothetical protein